MKESLPRSICVMFGLFFRWWGDQGWASGYLNYMKKYEEVSCSFVCVCMCMCVGVCLERQILRPTECVTVIFSSNTIISLNTEKRLCPALTSSAPTHQLTEPETSSSSDRYSLWQCWAPGYGESSGPSPKKPQLVCKTRHTMNNWRADLMQTEELGELAVGLGLGPLDLMYLSFHLLKNLS